MSVESIDHFEGENITTETSRRSVPGGWIYTTLIATKDLGIAATSTFVPFARYTGAEMEGRTREPAPPQPEDRRGVIPDFSQPVPRRDGWVR